MSVQEHANPHPRRWIVTRQPAIVASESKLVPQADDEATRRLSFRDIIGTPNALLLGSLVLTIALAVRLLTWSRILPHVDEPATLLAIQMTWEKGYPLFPSNIFYLQGVIISYLSAPFMLLFSGLNLLKVLQIANICISMVCIYLVYLLTTRVTNSVYPGFIAGLGVALDPTLIRWSVWIRPYNLLTAETIAIALCFILMVQNGPEAKFMKWPLRNWMAVLFWLGTFTHMAVWLALPPIIVIAVFLWKLDILRVHKHLLISFLVAVLAPLLLTVIGTWGGAGSTTAVRRAGVGFVGDHLLQFRRLLDPELSFTLWSRNYIFSQVAQLMPFFIVAIAGMLAGGFVQATTLQNLRDRKVIFSILTFLFVPIFVVSALLDPHEQPRYLVHLLPFGYVIIAIGAWFVWSQSPVSRLPVGVSVRSIATTTLLLPVLVYLLQSASVAATNSGPDPDYFAGMSYIAERHVAGEPIIVALTPIAGLYLDNSTIENDLKFLAGPENRVRTTRYSRVHDDGTTTDYWMGVPAITSTAELCAFLFRSSERAWILVDSHRLTVSWAFRGPMSNVITGASTLVADGENGVRVYRAREVRDWDDRAVLACTEG